MINFGVGLPGPPVYGTTVEIENGPKLFWDGDAWRINGIKDYQPALKEYPTDADHEAAMGYASEVSAALADNDSIEQLAGDGIVMLRFRGGWPTSTSSEIMELHLQRWFRLFMEKQTDYGDRGDDLGLKGQYAELHRKIGKLKRAMWDEQPLVGEQVDEIVLDLIGHCFLTLRYLHNNNTGGETQK